MNIYHFFLFKHRTKSFHSMTIASTHNKFMNTEFHYNMTRYISSLLYFYVAAEYMHHIHTPATYIANINFNVRLDLLITLVSHRLSLSIYTDKFIIVANHITKNITAQGPCNVPPPWPSIVPMVIP